MFISKNDLFLHNTALHEEGQTLEKKSHMEESSKIAPETASGKDADFTADDDEVYARSKNIGKPIVSQEVDTGKKSRGQYTCSTCNVRFKYLSGLRVHKARLCNGKLEIQLVPVRQVKPRQDGRFYCPHENCSTSNSMRNGLVAHYKKAHLGLRYPCSSCGVKLKSFHSLRIHKLSCKGTMERILRPVRQVTPSSDGRYYCPHMNCSSSNTKSDSLVTHYKVEHLGVRYPCSKCGIQLKYSFSLKLHKSKCKGAIERDLKHVRQVTPSRNGRYYCPHMNCSSSRIQRDALVAHYKVEHLGMRYPCSICGIQLKSLYSLKLHKSTCKGAIERDLKHVRRVTPSRNGRYYCPHMNCSSSSTKIDSLVAHYKVEHLGVRYPCSICGIQLKSLSSLQSHKSACKGPIEKELKHVRQVTPSRDGRYYCPHVNCPSSSSMKNGLVAHYKVEHLGVRYPCTKCGDQLKSVYSLNLHKGRCKGGKEGALKPVLQVTASSDGQFYCPHNECSSSSSDRSGLVVHYKVEHLGVRYPCFKCGCRLKSSGSLSVHKLTCKGTLERDLRPARQVTPSKDGRYYCPYENCSRSSTTNGHLAVHYKVHHLRFRFRCPKCDRGFMARQGLNDHKEKCKGRQDDQLKLLDQVKPAKDSRSYCPYTHCSFSCALQYDLVVHYNKKHLGVKHQCSKCNCYFKHLSSLISHKTTCRGVRIKHLNPAKQVTASKDGRFSCPHNSCTASCLTKKGLMNHYKIQHLGVRYPCIKCGIRLNSYDSLRMHKNTCKGSIERDLKPVREVSPGKDGQFHCPYENCSHSSNKNGTLVVHYKVHHLGFRYSCPKCDRGFMGSQGLNDHKEKCKGRQDDQLKLLDQVKPAKDSRSYCPYTHCSFSCALQYDLVVHYNKKHLGVKHQCSKCNSIFKHLSSLICHKTMCKGMGVKDLNPAKQVTASKDGHFYCPHYSCTASFLTKKGLMTHYKKQHLGVRYPCIDCGMQLISYDSLRTHKTSCKGGIEKELRPARQAMPGKDGRFYCPFTNCPHSSSMKNGLVSHYKAEHLDVRHPCQKCGVKLKSAYSLRLHNTSCKGGIERKLKHVRQVTPGRDGRFYCPFTNCSHSSSMKNGLVAHCKIKHLGVRYPCQNCKAQFQSVHDLNKHKCTGKTERVLKPAEHKTGDQYSLKTIDKVSRGKDGRFPCPYENCRSSYISFKTLEIHCKLVHQGVKFTCPRCRLQFTQSATLTNHMLSCNGGYQITSENDTKKPLEVHVDQAQDESKLEAVQQVTLGENGRFYCPKENCNTSYRRKCHLADHYKTIHLGIEYRCRECNGTFTTKHNYNEHIKTCDGRLKNQKYWSEKAKCIREVQVNADGRYHCPVNDCTMAYTLRHNLFKHYKVEHLGMRYNCTKCLEQFKSKSQLEIHGRTCTGNCHQNNFQS